MDPYFAKRAGVLNAAWPAELVWLPESGMGYYPVRNEPYTEEAGAAAQAYWDKYIMYANTDLGRLLTRRRQMLVERYSPHDELLLDVGIGCGQFLEYMSRNRLVRGCDVNPVARAWLESRGWLGDLERSAWDVMTFWDVFEHLPNPSEVLAHAGRWVVMSLPIFNGPEHVLRSKHFRKDEHRWYFRPSGLAAYMQAHHFECVEDNYMESELGREGIGTFVFRRTKPIEECAP